MTVTNSVAPHALASFGGRETPHLVAADESLRRALGSYYTLAVNALTDYQVVVRRAGDVSDEYKPEVRHAKQREVLRAGAAKVAAALDSEVQRLAAGAAGVRDELHKAAHPPPASESALLDFLMESELRRELAALTLDERRAFVREAARRGDLHAVRAVERSPVKPLIPDVDLQRAKAELLEAREPALTARAAHSEATLESARRTAALVQRHLRILTSDGKLDAKMLEDEGPGLTPEGERVDQIRRANPASRDYTPPEPREPEPPEAAAAS